MTPAPIASATPVVAASSSTPPPPIHVATTRELIEGFARARGGLHGEPTKMPYRTPKLKGAECWLFFVGGTVAHAAWLATPWDPAWGKPSAHLPNVEAVPSPLLQDGVVFERVESWPRAVRVIETLATPHAVAVTVESVAARDQPAGMAAVVIVDADIISGSMPTVEPVWMRHTDVITGALPSSAAASRDSFDVVIGNDQDKRAAALVHGAAASTQALARALAQKGADVLEMYQGAFFRKVARVSAADLSASTSLTAIGDALKIAASKTCDPFGVCGTTYGADVRGVVLVPDAKTFRIGAILVAPRALAVARDPAPTPVAPDEALLAFRMNQTPTGTLRPLMSVATGEKRLLVAEDESGAYLVESEGPYSHVSSIWNRHPEKSTVEARFDDVNGDGVTDVLVLTRWAKLDDKDVFGAHSNAIVVLRSHSISGEPVRDRLGLEVDALGAHDLDDLQKRVHAPVTGAEATTAEACSVLGKSTTQAGLVANATATGRIVEFDEPQSPSDATRIVPVARASAEDAAKLKDACVDPGDGGFFCKGGLCGNLDYGLGNVFRFVREGRLLKLETALIYVGS